MNRRLLWLVPVLAAAFWVVAQNLTPPPSPLPFFPPGAMLTLESRDLGQLLREWNASQVKKDWLASDAYRKFAVSRLALRLDEARQEFAGAARVPVDMALLEQAAGDRAALALYSPGDLEFLFVTRMTEARFAPSLLGSLRTSLSPRQAGGSPYFVATAPGSRRAIAFALRGEWLIVGTTESLVAQCLERLAASNPSGLAAEDWFSRAAQAAGPAGELRMAANFDALLASPHFRSYWLHRNRSELAPYSASISDLDRSAAAWTERRVLLRKETASPPAVNPALWEPILRPVPATAGLYRAWLAPDPNYAAALLVQKFFDPTPGASPASRYAPSHSIPGEAGEEGAWEDAIDAAPFVPGDAGPDASRLAAYLSRAQLTGLTHIQGTRDAAGNVWIVQDTGLVLTRNGNWNTAEIQTELALLGPAVPQFSVEGNRLLLANSPALLAAMRTGAANPAPPANARFAALFRHAAERPRFTRWMARIGQPTFTPPAQGEQREPEFLGDVAGSLSQALRGVAEQAVTTAEAPDRLTQTITYRMQ
jgi:hypothetical protein